MTTIDYYVVAAAARDIAEAIRKSLDHRLSCEVHSRFDSWAFLAGELVDAYYIEIYDGSVPAHGQAHRACAWIRLRENPRGRTEIAIEGGILVFERALLYHLDRDFGPVRCPMHASAGEGNCDGPEWRALVDETKLQEALANESAVGSKRSDHVRILHDRSVSDLISFGEGATLEFKSTLQWDMVEQRVNKQLRFSVLKTVAAFLNSAGGTLVLGVEDDGNVCGLEHDLKALQGSTDKFEQLLANLLAQHVGGHIGGLVRTRFEKLDTRTVCIVDVDRASAPVFLKEPAGTVFHVRFGNTTRQLDPEETLKYTQTNWE